MDTPPPPEVLGWLANVLATLVTFAVFGTSGLVRGVSSSGTLLTSPESDADPESRPSREGNEHDSEASSSADIGTLAPPERPLAGRRLRVCFWREELLDWPCEDLLGATLRTLGSYSPFRHRYFRMPR